ncbi:hypothetical protein [Streptomyces sp. NPDC056948]|uniref:hypothetical protein n=1 Tax=Streptomyces sp. NPDC056948 TaxID=3345975 RepID=UPI00363F3B9A
MIGATASSIEVAMLLRDVLSPLPMRPGWGESMSWPYPGIPAVLVADLAGGPVVGLPFFRPEAITVDHGAVFKNHHLVEVARTLGIDVPPARAMRPTDKAACERAFAAIQSLLLELVPGWRGIDVADRGAAPEADAAWTVGDGAPARLLDRRGVAEPPPGIARSRMGSPRRDSGASRLALLHFLARVQERDLARTRRWIADEERRESDHRPRSG